MFKICELADAGPVKLAPADTVTFPLTDSVHKLVEMKISVPEVPPPIVKLAILIVVVFRVIVCPLAIVTLSFTPGVPVGVQTVVVAQLPVLFET